MSWQTKIEAFDHIVFRLTEWFNEEEGNWVDANDLSRLKLTKLLFFVAACSSSPDEEGLLSIFDDFVAMPYGHVESTIQDHMDESNFYEISRNGLIFRNGIESYDPDNFANQEIAIQLDNAVKALREKNALLIGWSAFELVDLSHKWQSWVTIFSLAKQSGKLSMPIPSMMIQNEPKIFQ